MPCAAAALLRGCRHDPWESDACDFKFGVDMQLGTRAPTKMSDFFLEYTQRMKLIEQVRIREFSNVPAYVYPTKVKMDDNKKRAASADASEKSSKRLRV